MPNQLGLSESASESMPTDGYFVNNRIGEFLIAAVTDQDAAYRRKTFGNPDQPPQKGIVIFEGERRRYDVT
jgi:hypothetical protein